MSATFYVPVVFILLILVAYIRNLKKAIKVMKAPILILVVIIIGASVSLLLERPVDLIFWLILQMLLIGLPALSLFLSEHLKQKSYIRSALGLARLSYLLNPTMATRIYIQSLNNKISGAYVPPVTDEQEVLLQSIKQQKKNSAIKGAPLIVFLSFFVGIMSIWGLVRDGVLYYSIKPYPGYCLTRLWLKPQEAQFRWAAEACQGRLQRLAIFQAGSNQTLDFGEPFEKSTNRFLYSNKTVDIGGGNFACYGYTEKDKLRYYLYYISLEAHEPCPQDVLDHVMSQIHASPFY